MAHLLIISLYRENCKKFEKRVFVLGGKDKNYKLNRLSKEDVSNMPQKKDHHLNSIYIFSK